VIMIRKSVSKFVKFVKNQYDSIIWLKIEHLLQNVGDDLYLGCVYIPPNNSSFTDFMTVISLVN
jgi:endo-1,4-beta-mannosidase